MAKPVAGSVDVAIGQTDSPDVDLGPYTIIAVALPSTFDGTALTFLVSIDRTNFFPLCDPATGNARTVTAAASKAYDIDPKWFLGFNAMRFKCGTAQATTVTTIAFTKARIE